MASKKKTARQTKQKTVAKPATSPRPKAARRTRATRAPKGWLPDWVPFPTEEHLTHGEHVTVAEISRPTGHLGYLQLFTALADPTIAQSILKRHGEIGWEVSANGPSGISQKRDLGDYKPRFWISGVDVDSDDLEPLVVTWRSGARTVLSVDPGFLMTYGLVPRSINTGDETERVCWDDLEEPAHEIVTAELVSAHSFSTFTPAFVRIRRDHLQDYASLRGMTMLQVFYAEGRGRPDDKAKELLDGHRHLYLVGPGMKIQIQKSDPDGHEVFSAI